MCSIPPKAARGKKTQGSNSIMSTSFALKFWSNKIIDIDIIQSITLTLSKKLFIGFYQGKNLRWNNGHFILCYFVLFSAVLDKNIEKL